MRGINKVILVGNIGRDPAIQQLDGGIPVAKFSVATTEIRRDKNGQQISDTTWHNIVLWRGLAELAEKYLHKGSLVYIEGKLRNRVYEDKNGIKKFSTEIVGDNLVILDKRKDDTKLNENNPLSNLDNDDFLTNDFSNNLDDDLML